MDCVRNEDGRPTLRERGWGVLSRWLDMREKKEKEKVLFLRAHGFVARGILVLECALEKEMRTWVEREKKKVQWTSGERPEHGPRCRVHLRWPQRDADARTSMLQGGEWDDPKNKKKKIPGNSVREVGERIKGGAVREERSPETEAMLCVCVMWVDDDFQETSQQVRNDLRKEDQELRWATGTPSACCCCCWMSDTPSMHGPPRHTRHTPSLPRDLLPRDGPCVVGGWVKGGQASP